MLKNYIKVAFRNFLRHKGYSSINILGLSIGIAVCIVILLWIQYQFIYDKFHENIDELYWVCTYYELENRVDNAIGSPPALGPALMEEYPEIVNYSRYARNNGLLVKYGNNIFREPVRLVDPGFIQMFTIPFVKGDPNTALNDPFSIVISERIAEKYFGEDNPIGKMLKIQNEYDFTVTGVFENLPDNSTFGFDILCPVIFTRLINRPNYIDTWYNCAFYTFVQLDKNVDYQNVNERILKRIKQSDPESNLESYIFPFKKIHLHWISGEGGLIESVRMFAIIAFLILGIAIINFVNMITARSGRRAKEVALRKVVGAERRELIFQFLFEAIVHVVIASVLAVVLAELLLPIFRSLMGDMLKMNLFTNPLIPIGLVSIAIVTGLLSGSYPALMLSAYHPVKSLTKVSTVATKRSWFRRALVVTQFVVSILLIISTIVIYNQHKFLQHKDVGYDREQVLYIPLNTGANTSYESIKTELLQNPGIKTVSKSTHSPSGIYWNGEGWGWEGKNPNVNPFVTYVGVSYDYIETLGMKIIDGEFFSAEKSTGRDDAVVINREFAEVIGFDSAVNTILTHDNETYQVIGIVEDFHFMPVSRSIGALLMYFEPDYPRYQLFIRIENQDVRETLDYIGSIWKKFCPDFPYEYSFLDEDFENFYRGEKQFGDLLRYFGIFAIMLSCMGLFSLASYMAEQRTKEVGIRKVFGASVSNIIKLLSREFVILVMTAFLIASSIAYFLLSLWLQAYAYRTSLSIWIFLLTGISALLLALLTVGYQAVKAASSDPVKSLRYE